GKTLLHGDVLMWLMKTLLTSRCINQRGAGHGDIAEQGKIQRSPAVELLSPWQNLAGSHAEVLCITQQNPGQIIFCTDGKQVAVGRFKLRGLHQGDYTALQFLPADRQAIAECLR
ncbi:hypothetical protein M2T00_27325, partial [Klebsiella pneumoniae]|nr:hypothetical protein [Klebsiella pneumoniae]